jgi:hypothetical protein
MPYSLKCDAKDCNHLEEIDAILETDIGKPCPLCGANLLTAEDFAGFMEMVPAIEEARRIGELSDEPIEAIVSIGFHDEVASMGIEQVPEIKH